MEKEQKDKIARAAAVVVIEQIRSARRRVKVSRILGWSVIVLMSAFVVSLFVRAELTTLAGFLGLVAGFGIYQGVRVLRIAKGNSLAITDFEATLKEAYEKLSK